MTTQYNRTLQFYGYAYGNSTVSITATINGTEVFSGEVATLNEPIPLAPVDMSGAPVLFSVENSTLFPTTFSGFYPTVTTVTNGDGAVLGNVFSNYIAPATTDPTPGTDTVFGQCYSGIPTNSDNTGDPRSSVTIDGQAYPPGPGGVVPRIVPAGSTMECNLNVTHGYWTNP